MRTFKIPQVMFLGVAMAALISGTPAVANDAPPASNDDARVGAPPVIVAQPKAAPVAPPVGKPVPAKPAPVAVRAAPPIAAAAPPRPVVAVAPPMPAPRAAPPMPRQAPPQQAMSQQPMRPMPPHGPHGGRDGASDWHGPDRGPDGPRTAYHRPEYGYQLSQEWMTPDNYVGDYDHYGLSRPANGFGWSRYYDDAVLTDQWGRIYDWRDDVNWTDGDDRYARDDDRGGGWGGGRDRDRNDDRRDRKSRGKKYDYKGRWTGSWNGGPEQTYQGAWHGTVRPHWSGDRGDRGPRYGGSYGGGYGSSYAYGYDAGGTTVTTVVVQGAAPVMSTREISYDVVSYVPVRKKAVRRWRPKAKCTC